MSDIESFYVSLGSLLSLLEKVINDAKLDGVPVTEINKKLQRYSSVVMAPSTIKENQLKHYVLAYDKAKPKIEKEDNENWVTESKLFITCSDKIKTITLDVSSLYEMAFAKENKVRAMLSNMPPEALEGKEELIRCDYIKYHLLSMFSIVCPPGDKRNIADQTNTMKKILFIDSSSKGVNVASAANAPAVANVAPQQQAQSQTNPMDALAGILGGVKNFIGSTGMQLPQTNGQSGDPMTFLSKLLNPDTLSTIITSVTEKMKAADVPVDVKKDPLELGMMPVPPVAGVVTNDIVAPTSNIDSPLTPEELPARSNSNA